MIRTAIAAAVLAGACGGARGPTLQTLARPAFVWFRDSGLCGRSVALDRDGVLWAEAGCENPGTRYSRIRTLAPDERDRVAVAFAQVARAPVADLPADCPLRHRFIVMTTDAGYLEWQACATAGTDDDPTAGLPESFAEVVRDLPIK